MSYKPVKKDSRLKLKDGVYHARFSCRGQRVQKSLNTKNFKVAQRLVDDIQNTILLGLNWRKDKELFEEAWALFLEDKLKGIKTTKVSEKTLRYYAQVGESSFLEFWGESALDELTDESWDRYVKWFKSVKPDTRISSHRKYLNTFLKWAQKKGKIQEVPDLHDPDSDQDDDTPGKIYTTKELKRFREKAKMPLKLYIVMAQYMGMRSSEITQLHKSRVDLKNGFIRLKAADTKIKKGRVIPIHPEVMGLLGDQMKSHKGPYVFPHRYEPGRPMHSDGFKERWKKLKEQLKIEGKFHNFRHTYLTKAFKNPAVPHLMICAAAGLSIQVAQKHYVRFSDEDLKLVTDSFEL